MLGSSLALATGLMLLATAGLSGNPGSHGLVILVGIVFVAVACAMHLGAILDGVAGSSTAPWCLPAKLVVWLLLGGGTASLIARAPGEEVLLAIGLAPTAVGITGVVVGRANRWPAVTFLTLAVLVMALVGVVWLARHAG